MFSELTGLSTYLKLAMAGVVVALIVAVGVEWWLLGVRKHEVADAHAAASAALAQVDSLTGDLAAQRTSFQNQLKARDAADAALRASDIQRKAQIQSLSTALSNAGEHDATLGRCLHMRLPADVLRQLPQ